MSGTPIERWRAGSEPSSFSRGEAAALARHLMERGWAIYTNPKHPDHAALSAEISALNEVAHPGKIGAGGEVLP